MSTVREPDEAVEVLREVWSANGQSVADLDEAFGEPKACKRMADVNFDGYGESSDGDDLRAAWRQTLERDGKLGGEGSVRDLVFGQYRQTPAGRNPGDSPDFGQRDS